ncbi:uncharacterized protein [Miscanthus floridulus]|uniref:uncharacterized protein n=1 Tax=Miscanthus floridulus TaxID=154761 RepID=UPI00345A24DB
MAPKASLDGTVLAEGALSSSKVVQRIKEAMEPLQDDASAVLDVLRWGNLLALTPKKSIAIQVRRQSAVDVAPVLGGSGTSVTASSVDQASPLVAPVPSARQADAGARRMPSEVAEEPMWEAVPLSTTSQSKLLTALVAPTPAGAIWPNEALPMQAEVVAAMIGGPHPDATVAAPEAATRPAPPVTQMMAPDMGWTEGDTAEGSSIIMAVVERTSGGCPWP